MNYYAPMPITETPLKCLAVEPGYRQFPAICKLWREHEGPHEAGTPHFDGHVIWSDR